MCQRWNGQREVVTMGKKKIKMNPSEHSERWDANERKTERAMAGGRDDKSKVQWGYDLGKRRKKGLLDRLRRK